MKGDGGEGANFGLGLRVNVCLCVRMQACFASCKTQENTLVVLERWPLMGRLASREEGQDVTVAGKKRPGGEAGGRVRCRSWAKGGRGRAEEYESVTQVTAI